MSLANVAIIIPTLARPKRIPAIVRNLAETAPNARAHFVVELSDDASMLALTDAEVESATVGEFGTYARAINAGYLDCPEPYVMTSDDDVVYRGNWLANALRVMRERPGVYVVGTNDLHNPYVLAGEHSTHTLIDRRYIDEVGCVIDEPRGRILFHYDHNYTDAELVETAKARGVFRPCLDAIAEHIHPEFGGREADETWLKTRRNVASDHAIFMERRALWRDHAESALAYELTPELTQYDES